MKKKVLWKSLYESDTLEMFVSVSECLEESDYIFEEAKLHVSTHLSNYARNFKNLFLELTVQRHEWMRNTFAVPVGEISHLSVKANCIRDRPSL
jgi:hypothetical protein